MAKNKKNVNKSTASAKKFENEKPILAQKYNIRVSNPYGYYPEDVDKLITTFENTISSLEKENKKLAEERDQAQSDLSKAQSQIVRLKMDMSLMEQADTSAEEDFVNMSRIGKITGKIEPQVMPKPLDNKPTMPVGVIGGTSNNTQQKVSHSNLIRPKVKINNTNKGE